MVSRVSAVAIDAVDPELVAGFWCEVLGWQVVERDDEVISIGSGDRSAPGIDVVRVPERKQGKNRLHLDLRADGLSTSEELDRLLALGARRADVGQPADVSWVVLADPEGNELCLLSRTQQEVDAVDDAPLMIDSSPLPEDIPQRLRDQLGFIAEADKLKTILRASPLAAVARRENDAEHSWHLALMVMLLAEHADEPIDVGHAMRLVVIHDLVEIYAGDSPVFDAAAVVDQVEREEAAADRLYALLPADQASEMRALWDEFEAGRTPEARFCKGMDRLQPMLLNWLNHGGTWQMPGATESTVRAREAGVVAASTTLGTLTGRLVEEGLARGWIRPGDGARPR